MTVDSAFKGAIDANFYPICIEAPLLKFAIGYPFNYVDNRPLFRFFVLHVHDVLKTGEWDSDADGGWAIEAVTIDDAVHLQGDACGVMFHLNASEGGSVGDLLLDRYPDPVADDCPQLLAQKLFANAITNWNKLEI